jgi:hypothetical protein
MNLNPILSGLFKGAPSRNAAFLWVFLTAWALVCPALADSSTGAGIQDPAGFFSERAKNEAGAIIAQTASKLRKDFRVETFAEIPANIRSGVNLQDKSASAQMYEKWARQEAATKKVNGVYVLLVKNPAHLHIVESNKTREKAFTTSDRDALVAIMLGKLREKKADEALLEGTRFVAGQMKLHATETPRPSSGHAATVPEFKTSDLGWLPSLIIIAIVGMLILRLIGGIFGGIFGSSPMGAPSGGGFFRSLLGGIFGAAAGMWLYDHFFGHSSGPSAWGSEGGSSDSSPFGDAPSEYSESDYSGSGADFGDDGSGSSSGGDFGSSDDFSSGGGDFGGSSD